MTFPKIVSTTLLAGFVALTPALAQKESQPNEPNTWNPLATFQACTDIDNDIARLQCFDAAAAGLGGEEQEVEGEAGSENVAEPSAGTETSEELTEPGDAKAAEEESEPATKTRTPRPTDPMQIIEADEPMVAECEFLGSVQGKSGWGGLAANAARKGSIRSAKKKAFKLGATHIVFREFDNGIGMKPSSIAGRAYRCD